MAGRLSLRTKGNPALRNARPVFPGCRLQRDPEMDDGRIYVYKGDYDYFLRAKSLRQEVQASEMQKDKNIYRRELEWMRSNPRHAPPNRNRGRIVSPRSKNG